MFLISEASSLIIFLEVTEKKLARSHHVQSGWVIISSPFISGRGSAPLSFHSAEQWGQGRPRGLGAPGLPRSLSRARRLEVAPGWSQAVPQPRLSWGTESLDACGERVDGHSGPQASRPVPPLPPPGVCPPEDAGATGRQTPGLCHQGDSRRIPATAPGPLPFLPTCWR